MSSISVEEASHSSSVVRGQSFQNQTSLSKRRKKKKREREQVYLPEEKQIENREKQIPVKRIEFLVVKVKILGNVLAQRY